MSKEVSDRSYLAFLSLVYLALAASGCSSQGRTVGLTGGLGALGGASLGGIADPGKKGELRTRNIVVGAALGGMAGLVAGQVAINEIQKQRSRGSDSPASAKLAPTLKPAQVESRWIEGHSQGQNLWIEGHYEYRIIEPSRWESE
jgi:hypothetical protein